MNKIREQCSDKETKDKNRYDMFFSVFDNDYIS